MNVVTIIGRLTKDPILLKVGSGQTNYTRFALAVPRPYKTKNGEREADFINCIAWGFTAEFLSKYFKKGNRIGAFGNIKTSVHADSEGKKIFTTDVVVEKVDFADGKNAEMQNNNDTYFEIDDDDVSLPF